MRVRRGAVRVDGASPKVSRGSDDAVASGRPWLDSVFPTIRAAHELIRMGAREPALNLFEDLARASAPFSRDGPLDVASSPDQRLLGAREHLARWLSTELGGELAWARSITRRMRRIVLAALVTVVLFAAARAWLAPRDISPGARWVASSTLFDNQFGSGTLPEHGLFFSPPFFFFHTKGEPQPSLTIDLGQERTVSAVELWNRLGLLPGAGERRSHRAQSRWAALRPRGEAA